MQKQLMLEKNSQNQIRSFSLNANVSGCFSLELKQILVLNLTFIDQIRR
jgi:hypothetical protein